MEKIKLFFKRLYSSFQEKKDDVKTSINSFIYWYIRNYTVRKRLIFSFLVQENGFIDIFYRWLCRHIIFGYKGVYFILYKKVSLPPVYKNVPRKIKFYPYPKWFLKNIDIMFPILEFLVEYIIILIFIFIVYKLLIYDLIFDRQDDFAYRVERVNASAEFREYEWSNPNSYNPQDYKRSSGPYRMDYRNVYDANYNIRREHPDKNLK